jgi:hypothetical protein
MGTMKIDTELLKKFEAGLDPRYPDKSKIPAAVLGYGEMSTVFEIGAQGHRDLAYKRMPIFNSLEEVPPYETIYNEYNDILTKKVGIRVPPYDCAVITTDDGRVVMFDVQKKVPPESIGNRAIHVLGEEDVKKLVRLVLRELKKVWDFNAKKGEIQIGIDGQISNWSIEKFDPKKPKITDKTTFLYLDTSTPFIQKDGVEQLDPELFLRAAPSFLIWVIRWLFLEDVMTRYYDFHLVVVDLIANFYKEQLPELIPGLVEVANDFFTTEAKSLGVEPITEKKVKSYYTEDAWIWRLWMFFRKVDRFIKTRIARKGYPFILPGKIKR